MAAQRQRWIPLLFGAVLGGLVFLLVHRALLDDSYLTLGYARNLAEHGHWGLLADRPSNTATSPLNVWSLGALTFLIGRPVVAGGVLPVVTMAAAAWWADGLRRESAVSRALPYIVVALLACSPLLVSTVGLETYMGTAALLGVARYAAADRRALTGVLLGSSMLVRPDLAVPAAVLAAALLGLRTPKAWLVPAAVAVLVALPWHLFAWIELGGFVPDTVWLKADDSAWGSTFADGWGFYVFGGYTRAALLALAPAIVGLAATLWFVARRGTPGRAVGLAFAGAGVAHWGAFALLGTAPYAWYLAPSVVCLSMTAAVASCTSSGAFSRGALTATGLLMALSAAFLVVVWPWSYAPMSTNWGSATQYSAMGADLARVTRGEPVRTQWEVGTPAFFCRCPLLDPFGDPAQADARIRAQIAHRGQVTRTIATWNSYFRVPSPPTPATRWALAEGDDPKAAARWQVAGVAGDLRWGSLTLAR